ncbi:hypothetical protein OBBRIDRAFT_784424 [Obba rivulosa]|uniref:BTB domain-containing protein n=1 Tax=Obba rivulosa TaxID=1052685 RepID=A0A8E2AUT7_9APHY|nr:hypothetical protein OBBRIDRAFT_784424 [Obba rivulosa]
MGSGDLSTPSSPSTSPADPDSSSAQPTRSTEYYFDDGTHIFRVQNTLYKLHAGILAKRLDMFNSMFSLPITSQNMPEGRSDDRPLYPPQTSAKEFEYLLRYIYSEWEAPPHALDYLIAVLKLSSQWDLPSGRRWALHHLQDIQNQIPAALQLKLARMYNIEDWIRPALARLVRTPLKNLTFEDRGFLGPEAVFFIARVREGLENLRKTIAVVAPEIENKRSPDCSTSQHQVCMRVWSDAWFRKITRKLIHPHPLVAMHMFEGIDQVKKLDLSGMTPGCRERAISFVEVVNAFAEENHLIDQAVQMFVTTVPIDSTPLSI